MDTGSKYRPAHKIRFVTASALFDGHDVSINIMRRMLQASGAEVIHLGHNRSAGEIVQAAIQEDVQGIAVSSYQGGHMEFFTYMIDLLREKGAESVKVFGGGGGVIRPSEIKQLHDYGLSRIFSPDDGRMMGLQGMIDHMLRECDFSTIAGYAPEAVAIGKDARSLAKLITAAEQLNDGESVSETIVNVINKALLNQTHCPIIGITGTGGAGKSSLTDELIRRFLRQYEHKSIAVLSVDPTKKRTGGALLGDRIRMNAVHSDRVYMRSLATRGSGHELTAAMVQALAIVKAAGFDLILVETSGIGQGDHRITQIADVCLYVMTSEYGAPSQLEKIDMLDHADLVAINKFDRRGSVDALRDVKKQFQRNLGVFDQPYESMPVYGTMASRFNDSGIHDLFTALIKTVNRKCSVQWTVPSFTAEPRAADQVIIPPERVHYLGEIVQTVRDYRSFVDREAKLASRSYQIHGTLQLLKQDQESTQEKTATALQQLKDQIESSMTPSTWDLLNGWPELFQRYSGNSFVTRIRDKDVVTELTTTSLSGLDIPKVSLPKYQDWGDLIRWQYRENVPGMFPFTAGVFPFKHTAEDPKRQFAGEGTPYRTNLRFHYLSRGDQAKRLSTAFDSVTLYGEDPDYRPDIYGKIGESGVSICTLDDMKKLYAGFDLCDPLTSVSMTINGPAPVLLAMYMNTAIDFAQERFHEKLGRAPTPEEADRLRRETMQSVRGTVQADILKEDQGQNTCIFSTEFALRMMGDIQQYFIDHKVRHYYTVSISSANMFPPSNAVR